MSDFTDDILMCLKMILSCADSLQLFFTCMQGWGESPNLNEMQAHIEHQSIIQQGFFFVHCFRSGVSNDK